MAPGSRIENHWERWTSPPPDENRSELQYWQERILYSFLLISIVLGLIVLIPSVMLSIKEDLWIVAVADAFIYVWALVLFFYRRLSYKIRVMSVVVLSYGLGLELLIIVGPFGGGPVWLFFFPIVTGLLTNLTFAIISQLINGLTFFVFGWLVFHSYYDWPFLEVHPMESWVVMALNFLLLNSIATLSIAIVSQGLQNSLSQKKAALNALKANNEELRFTNQRLVDEINLKNQATSNLQRSENALRESEIRFRELVSVLPLGYFLLDKDFTLRFINQKAINTFGFDEQMLDKAWQPDSMTMLAAEDRQRVFDSLLQVFQGSEMGWGRYTISLKKGDIPVEIYAGAIANRQDTAGVHGLIVDITDRLEKESLKTAKEVAEKTNQSISEWVSFIAHEIRGPISAPLSYSKLGLEKLKSDRFISPLSEIEALIVRSFQNNADSSDPARQVFSKFKETLEESRGNLEKYFDRIYTASDRLNALLDELLDLSKLESGRMSFSFQQASLHSIVQDAVLEFEAIIREKELVLKIEEPGMNTTIECDPFRIGQLIRNLLSNAVKFTPKDKTIEISFIADTIKKGRRSYDIEVPAVRTTVADQGIGIPASDLDQVFEKFKQSRKSRKGEGTGLGLPICKEIVVAHSGWIEVESQENKGASFSFTLPCQRDRYQ